MTIHRAFAAYLVLVHGLVAAVIGVVLWESYRPWILALELGLIVSLTVGYLLIRTVRLPRDIVQVGTAWMKEGDIAHSFKKTGLKDIDDLVQLYNDLASRLREERVRLEEQEVLLHRLMSASPSGIIIVDHEGRVSQLNPAAERLIHGPRATLLGKRLTEHAIPVLKQLEDIPLGESRLLGHRGRKRLRCTHSEFYDRGSPRDFYIIDDLTHELWATEKLAYESLIRSLSHEVNNTVGATNSILHSALEYGGQLREDDRKDFLSALRVAIDRTDNLNAFMRRYADVVRVPVPVRQPVRIEGLIEKVVKLMETQCTTRGITLTTHFHDTVGPIPMDIVQMEQALEHIVLNAMEAIGRDGQIDIHIRSHDSRPAISIEDTGPGLTPEEQDQVFTPFFSTKNEGQGVGLTLVKEILTLHGFSFELSSEPGERTRFLIEL